MPRPRSEGFIKAIQRGAVQRVARDLWTGFRLGDIIDKIKDIFGIGDRDESEEIGDLGRRSRQAGIDIPRAVNDAELEAIDIPRIPWIDPDSLEGGRFEYTFEYEWTNPETGQTGKFFVRHPSPTLMGPEDFEEAAYAHLQFLVGRYPERFGDDGAGDSMDVVSVELIGAVARW